MFGRQDHTMAAGVDHGKHQKKANNQDALAQLKARGLVLSSASQGTVCLVPRGLSFQGEA